MSATSTRTLTKVLAGEEDLLYGEGLANQTRGEQSVIVNKVRGFRPVNSIEELEELDVSRFPKAVLVENGTMRFLEFDGSYYADLSFAPLPVTVDTTVSSVPVSARTVIVFDVESPHTVSLLAGGNQGQEITLVSTQDAKTTIENNATISLKGTTDYAIPLNTGLKLVYIGTVWMEV